MKDRKSLNLALSICIVMCTLICTIISVSDSAVALMFGTRGELIAHLAINWNLGGPLIGFASLAAALALIKLILCSIPAIKEEKGLGAIALVCDIVVILALSMIASSIGTWENGSFTKIDKIRDAVIPLLMVGSPAMLIAGIGSWIANWKAAE